MDYLKLFAKAEKEIENSTAPVQMISKDIGMEFGVGKCIVRIFKRGGGNQ